MPTISLCMIVKNEELILARCLDSLKGIMDEIIIVDTGSTDRTKEIASKYTKLIYDYTWTNDFAAARNFAFSKAGMEYIYSADADEVLDGENRRRLLELKAVLPPEVEIVQMKYGNQLQFNTIYNFEEEYRPKLFKRVRSFLWEEAIHETIRITPVIYDSDIVITHMPRDCHSGRDFKSFERQTAAGSRLSARLHNIYARELFISGTDMDFQNAAAFFEQSAADTERGNDEVKEACLVTARAARLDHNTEKFFKYILKVIAQEGCSEGCYELGEFYLDKGDYAEAAIWLYNACYETAPLLNIRLGGDLAMEKLAVCYDKMDMPQLAEEYRQASKHWKAPEHS